LGICTDIDLFHHHRIGGDRIPGQDSSQRVSPPFENKIPPHCEGGVC
jgi:hypothetical protein